MARVGITLQPEQRFLDLLQPVFDEADYFQVAPETTWRPAGESAGESAGWQPNGYWQRFLDEGRRRGKPFTAHAVFGSLGTVAAADRGRQAAWLQRLIEDQRHFHYEWLTDHLGASVLGECAVALPIALPMNDTTAGVVRQRLIELQQVVPDVGFENSAFYFLLGSWRDEPAFFANILTAPRTHLLLDLHNVYTNAVNFGESAERYLEQLDLSRVIEIHLSGGVDCPQEWLPDGESRRLDSHDADVPEQVWSLFERVLPRCESLRGVTLERMEGTVGERDVARIASEMQRIREAVHAHR